MRIIVAGGAGFIGSHLVDLLLQQGHHVIALDNFITGRKSNLLHLNKDKYFSILEHNIINPIEIEGSIDQIFNLASPASPIDFERLPLFILETAAIGHRNLLNLAHDKKARILLASTSEVYGDPLVHPQTESYFGNVNPIGLRSCYDEAKRYAEALTIAHRREFGTNACIARIFNTYGPRMRPEDGRVIPSFFSSALKKQSLTIYGDGKQTRSLCYVDDLIKGLTDLMQSDLLGPFNFGNPHELSINELGDIINSLLANNQKHNYLPASENDPQRRKPNIDQAKAKLGWSPTVDLKEGLAKTLAWFQKEVIL